MSIAIRMLMCGGRPRVKPRTSAPADRMRAERARAGSPVGVIRIGCSGWSYGDWRGRFYPAGLAPARWLEHYAATFDTVEVNATFYRLARRSTVERWLTQVPDGFCFAVKASRYLTHVRRLSDMERGVGRLLEPLEPLRAAGRLGPLLWQLPERFARDDERLAFALSRLPPGRHAFELRHPSWTCPEVRALLRSHGVALAIADRPGLEVPSDPLTADFAYVRLHHGRRGRRGNYSRAELELWAQRIAKWARAGDVYAYFNNDREAFAPRNARALGRMLDQAGARGDAPDRRRAVPTPGAG